jgi:hypothetical protein
MEAKNFRPLNLVKSGNGIYRIFAVSTPQVLAIQDYKEPIGSQKNVYQSDNTIINPIELTEKWLLDFGFKRENRGSVSAQFHIGINPVTHDWLFDIVWLKDMMDYSLKDYPFYRNGHFELKYVHQLQNLFFALTGTELELKNECSTCG